MPAPMMMIQFDPSFEAFTNSLADTGLYAREIQIRELADYAWEMGLQNFAIELELAATRLAKAYKAREDDEANRMAEMAQFSDMAERGLGAF